MADLGIGGAAFLGVVEGLTEFIPVSSTGHLILAGEWAGFSGASLGTFNIMIQLGAMLAVVWLYRARFLGLFDFSAKAKNFRGWDGMFKLGLACLPIFVTGAFLGPAIKARLFWHEPVVLAMLVGGLAMLWVEERSRICSAAALEDLTWRQCLGVGLFQCLALWPGMSRSASTIVGGMLLGLDRRVAAELSFLAAAPVLTAACGFELLQTFGSLRTSDIMPFAVGLLVSFLTALAAVRFFLGILGRWTLRPFAVYRVIAALLIFWWMAGKGI